MNPRHPLPIHLLVKLFILEPYKLFYESLFFLKRKPLGKENNMILAFRKNIYLLLILGLVIIDQITKSYFGFVKNTGAAFGILQGYNLLLIGIGIIALGFFTYSFHSHRLACSLVISGIIGNLIDRIFLGYVRDFIDLRIWPVFNLADSFAVIVIGLLIVGMLRKK